MKNGQISIAGFPIIDTKMKPINPRAEDLINSEY